MLKIYVIIGSVRENRFGDKPANWIFEKLKKTTEVEAELIDLKEWNLPMFAEGVSPSMNKGQYSLELGSKWAEKIGEADGYIFVSPEYNHGYCSALKNAIDYVYSQWNNKPVGFVSYGGGAGGARAVEQLREVVVELQMVPIRNAVNIVNYWSQLDEKGNLKTENYEQAGQGLIDQLVSWAKLLKSSRDQK